MIGQFVGLFGFFITVATIFGLAYLGYKFLHFLFGGAVFLVLFLFVVFFWVPEPLAFILSPLQDLLRFLWTLCLTVVLDGLNFVRNMGG